MEAATENKRGRPTIKVYAEAMKLNNAHGAYNHEIGERALQNRVNAEYFIVNALDNAPNELYFFFATMEGNTKHNGIAEQIGRLMRANYLSAEQAIDIARQAMDEYKNGATSKQIEQQLRQYKKYLQKESE